MHLKKREKKWNDFKKLSNKRWRDKERKKRLRRIVRVVGETVSKIEVVKEKDLEHLVRILISLNKVLIDNQSVSSLILS